MGFEITSLRNGAPWAQVFYGAPMKPNVNRTSGIRYGVITLKSLDPEVAEELWCGPGARNLSEEQACQELREQIREEVGREYERGDRDPLEEDSEIDYRYDEAVQGLEIDEPVIEGTYEGVKYRIDWLGGAPLLWVTEGPIGSARQLCSPCVPNAGDLDSGFTPISPNEEGADEVVSFPHECYVVPAEWLRQED